MMKFVRTTCRARAPAPPWARRVGSLSDANLPAGVEVDSGEEDNVTDESDDEDTDSADSEDESSSSD